MFSLRNDREGYLNVFNRTSIWKPFQHHNISILFPFENSAKPRWFAINRTFEPIKEVLVFMKNIKYLTHPERLSICEIRRNIPKHLYNFSLKINIPLWCPKLIEGLQASLEIIKCCFGKTGSRKDSLEREIGHLYPTLIQN